MRPIFRRLKTYIGQFPGLERQIFRSNLNLQVRCIWVSHRHGGGGGGGVENYSKGTTPRAEISLKENIVIPFKTKQ